MEGIIASQLIGGLVPTGGELDVIKVSDKIGLRLSK